MASCLVGGSGGCTAGGLGETAGVGRDEVEGGDVVCFGGREGAGVPRLAFGRTAIQFLWSLQASGK
jgi:hypothetical protein